MKNKFKTFFGAIGYLILAVIMQIVVFFIGGIIAGIYYNIKVLTIQGETLDPYKLTEWILSLTNIFLLISSIATVLILILIYKIKKRDYKEELQINRTAKLNVILGIILGISAWMFNTGVLNLISEAGLFANHFEVMNETLSFVGEGSILFSILTVGIIAPFAEEFLFRGVIYNTLNRRLNIKWVIIIQAILFGVFHGNMIQGAYATVLGLVFGYITYKTNSLWPAIIMHMANNSTSVLVSYFASDEVGGKILFIAFIIIGLILMITSLVVIKNKNIVQKEEILILNDSSNLN